MVPRADSIPAEISDKNLLLYDLSAPHAYYLTEICSALFSVWPGILIF